MKNKLKIGLFGLGCVGQGFYDLLTQSSHPLLEVKKIVVRNLQKERSIHFASISTAPADVLEDEEIDVVVELIDDANVAFEILKQSLQKGKPVVTANKKMLAENLEEIFWLQKKYATPVLYEGAVCGSIPFIHNLEHHFAADEIKSIDGIFNGSTNYILTKMFEERMSFNEALSEAQQLGLAESDPRLDVKGFDARYKLAITIAHAFGCFVNPDHILCLGIDKISVTDIRWAQQNGFTIKLVAKVEKIGNQIVGLVAPQFVRASDALAQVKNEFNAIQINGVSSGTQTFTGKGAGSLPTGTVVLSDVISLISNFRYHYPKIGTNNRFEFAQDGLLDVRISFQGDAPIILADFEVFNGGFQGRDQQFMNGLIRVQKLKEWQDREDLSIILNQGTNSRIVKPKKEHEFSYG